MVLRQDHHHAFLIAGLMELTHQRVFVGVDGEQRAAINPFVFRVASGVPPPGDAPRTTVRTLDPCGDCTPTDIAFPSLPVSEQSWKVMAYSVGPTRRLDVRARTRAAAFSDIGIAGHFAWIEQTERIGSALERELRLVDAFHATVL